MSEQINSPFSLKSEGSIWKLHLDESNNMLVLEIRNSENRKADFIGFNLKTKKTLWKGLKVDESWWLGVEQVKEGKLILHEYKDPQNPEHKGLIVVDNKTGKLIWEQKMLTLFSLLKDQVLAYDAEEEVRVYQKLDLQTGKKVGEVKEAELLKNLGMMMNAKSGADHGEDIKNAFHFTAEHPYFTKIAEFIKESMNLQPVVAMDYLEEGKYLLISFYVTQNETLNNYLILVDDEGLVKYKEIIGKNLKGVGMDTFFVYKNMVIFVKDKSELLIYELA